MNLPLAPFGEVQTAEKSLLTYINFHYNINSEIVTATTANNGTVTQGGSAGILTSSATTNGSAQIASRLPARYISGQGLIIVFSALFGTPYASNLQEAGYGNTSDGFFFDYNGTDFGINRRSSVTGSVVNDRLPQASWLNNKMPELNQAKFNVFAVSFQWLGAGEIAYWIEDRNTGLLEVVHKIRYANSAEVLSLLNPTLPLWARNVNSGNTTSNALKIGNMAAYVFGNREMVGPRQSARAALAYTISGEKVVIAIENMTDVFAGTGNNRSMLLPDYLSYSTDGSKSATFRVKRCNISGGTSAAINANTSIAKKYTGTPSITNEKLLFVAEAAKVDQGVIKIPDDIILAPGEAIIVTAESAASNDVTTSFSWKDLL